MQISLNLISKYLNRLKLKIVLIFLFFVIILVPFFYFWLENRYQYENWNTESNLFIIPENSSFDLLIMGTSHGRIFSRNQNHLIVEKILSKKILNISYSSGGIIPEEIFLEYFFKKGNKTKSIVYFIDPFVLYSSSWNEKFYDLGIAEPINALFLSELFSFDINKRVIFDYFASKFTLKWITKKPNDSLPILQTVSLNNSDIKWRINNLYPDSMNNNNFNKYANELKKVVSLSEKNNAKIVFVIPSTLFEDPGNKQLEKLLKIFKEKYNIPYYDYSSAIKDSNLFYDIDHLNRRGIIFFTTNYLKKIFN